MKLSKQLNLLQTGQTGTKKINLAKKSVGDISSRPKPTAKYAIKTTNKFNFNSRAHSEDKKNDRLVTQDSTRNNSQDKKRQNVNSIHHNDLSSSVKFMNKTHFLPERLKQTSNKSFAIGQVYLNHFFTFMVAENGHFIPK